MILKIGPNAPDIHPTAFIHPTAEISGKVKIGPRVSIWGGCILRGDVDWITIGEDSNVQDGTVMHTSKNLPVILEKGVTVGHRAVIHGATIGSYSLIGMSATLLDGAKVGKNCLIGGGALVREHSSIPDGHLALGLPAKPVRPLHDDEIKMIVDRATDYIEYATTYKKALLASGD